MPDFTHLIQADLAIQLHVIAATIAALLTPLAILRNRRDLLHKVTGYLWVSAMAATAISSFWITNIRLIGPFSPIHIISIWTLYSLYHGVRLAIARNIKAHRAEMRSLAFGALGLAGSLAFMPGRIMNRAFFGEYQITGFVFVLLILAGSVLFFGEARWATKLRQRFGTIQKTRNTPKKGKQTSSHSFSQEL